MQNSPGGETLKQRNWFFISLICLERYVGMPFLTHTFSGGL